MIRKFPFLILLLFFFIQGGQAQTTEQADNKIYNQVDVKPEYPGGMKEFYNYIGENYRVPRDFKETGRLIIQFVVDRDGSLTEIKIIRDLGSGTGDEAIRVLSKSPKWIPGKQDGVPVRVLYTLPISLQEPAKK